MAIVEEKIAPQKSLLNIDTNALESITAQLDDRQLLWLSGYLYGISTEKYAMRTKNTQVSDKNTPPSVSSQILDKTPTVVAPTKATILYGTQSGNAKKAAQKTAEALKINGLEVSVGDMADFKTTKLKDEKLLFLVVSTYGEGEPPAAAEDLHKFIFGNRAPKLPDLQFSVLGLGDSSYTLFCQTGKDFDLQLEKLGAKRLASRADCDVDWHDEADKWIDNIVKNLPKPINNGQAQNGTAFVKNEVATAINTVKYDRKTPFQAEILEKIQLNGRGSTRETWHIELSLDGSALQYAAGDVLHVVPTNSERIVSEVLKASNTPPSVSLDFEGKNRSFGDVLIQNLELSVLTRDVVQRYYDFSKNEKLKNILADTKALQSFLYGRDVADLLTEFPAEGLDAENLVKILRKMPSRAYSIASSLLAHPDEVHLTVGAVRYNAFGRKKQGVASTFLADRVQIGEKVPIFIEENTFFKLPQKTDTPIIMIGAGTGIAPFRAFVEERAENGDEGKNWLFFGNPHFKTDFLYQTEWQQYLKKGNLSRLDVAFSRDQKEKIYVQHKLQKNSKEVYNWLQNGANLYVCGDKNKMAGDVEKALIQIAAQEGGLSTEQATAYIKDLKKQRRYLEDVY